MTVDYAVSGNNILSSSYYFFHIKIPGSDIFIDWCFKFLRDSPTSILKRQSRETYQRDSPARFLHFDLFYRTNPLGHLTVPRIEYNKYDFRFNIIVFVAIFRISPAVNVKILVDQNLMWVFINK